MVLKPNDYQCSPCGAVFGTLDLFDAHQHWSRDWASLRCEIPAEAVQDRRGVWQTPAGLAKREGFADRMAAARSGVGAKTDLSDLARGKP